MTPDYETLYRQYIKGMKQSIGVPNQYVGFCPFHNDKKNRSFSFNTANGLSHCFTSCFKGNAYQFAVEMNHSNPSEWINENIKQPPNHQSVMKPAKTNLFDKAKEYQKNLSVDWIKESSVAMEIPVGEDKQGRLTFPYFDEEGKVKGIKHHKGKNGESPYWEGNGSCQIFLEHKLVEYSKDKPLYIFEGEKDVIVSPLDGVAFSAGAGSIPIDISPLYQFRIMYIAYDHDKAGRDGSKKLAERIKRESPLTKVMIIKWDENLPEGYDVTDDFKETRFSEFDKAIISAVEFEFELPNKIGVFTVMTGREASITEPPPTEWLVENVLPKKFNTCLAGTTGSKKSMWAIQLGMCLANGDREFCGNPIKTSGIKVLYVDTEIGIEELHRRYKRIQNHLDWNGDQNFLMLSKEGTHVDVWEDVHRALDYYKPELIVFDSLYNTTSVGDFSKSAQMSRVTDALTKFKQMYGVTVLTIAHFNKGQHDMGLMIDRMQGSAVLQNWIEYQILMISTNVDNFNLWSVAKARGVRHDKSVIGLKWDNFWFETKGVVDDFKPFLITEHKNNKWFTILEDLPDKFDTQKWLSMFSTNYPSMSERTGKQWLKECSGSPMLNRISHGLYEKSLRLIDEDNIDG